MRRTSVLQLALFMCSVAVAATDGRAAELATALRRPVALVTADNDHHLYVANRAGGTISTIDLSASDAGAGEVPHSVIIVEDKVGQTLTDMVLSPDERFLFVTDEAAGHLIVIERQEKSLVVAATVPVAQSPQSVRVTHDGRICFVTSLWGRAVTVLDLSGLASSDKINAAPRVITEVSLPFAPRCQCLVENDTRLVVTDAFGGSIAVLDTQKLKVISVRELLGHNIRGIALSNDGRQLLLAHQVLNSYTETLQKNVFWGAVITNAVRTLPIETFTSAAGEPLPVTGAQTIGGLGAGAGDPAGLAVTAAGDVILTLAGVQEIAMRRAGQFGWQRERVGKRPTAVTLSSDGRRALVANTFADSITTVDVEAFRVERTIKLGPQPELSAAQRGEQYFYDARLSLDGWFSCHSCHTDGHSNGLTSDNFGDDAAGAPKRIPSLLGSVETGPWAWDGHVSDMEDQIRSSLVRTMRSPNPTDARVAGLAEFVRGLPAPPRPENVKPDNSLVQQGEQIFARTGCVNCHRPPTYTSPATYEVGIVDELGRDRFNPPSLRGVRLRPALFHDNSCWIARGCVAAASARTGV